MEKCQLYTSKSTLNDFVLVRSRRKRISTRRTPSEERVPAPIAPKAANADSGQKPSEEETQQRIAAVKARKNVMTPSLDGAHFDQTQTAPPDYAGKNLDGLVNVCAQPNGPHASFCAAS